MLWLSPQFVLLSRPSTCFLFYLQLAYVVVIDRSNSRRSCGVFVVIVKCREPRTARTACLKNVC